MYIPVSANSDISYSEGFVVKFYKSDNTEWVANFKSGWTDYSLVADYPEQNKIVVIAFGQGYIMTPDQYEPLGTFGVNIKTALTSSNNQIIAADDVRLYIINEHAKLFYSERISLDGIKDLAINGNIISGLSCYPSGNKDEWLPFTLDLETKEITGGSYFSFFGGTE